MKEGAARAEGVVVVVDVIRAFTTTPFLLAAGAREVLLFADTQAALAARAARPDALLVGDEGSAPPPGFDHGNSPTLLPSDGLRGRVVLQRTGSGASAALAALAALAASGASGASAVYLASLVVAAATARAVARRAPAVVTVVESGGAPEGDDAVADHLEGLLRGAPPPLAETLRRIRACSAASEFAPAVPFKPPQDVACCMAVDFFDFAVRAEPRGGALAAVAE